MTKEKPKTSAERQAAHQARLREMTPLERAWKSAGFVNATLYTDKEQALVDVIKVLTTSLQAKSQELHGLLVDRFTELPEVDPQRRLALAELQGSFARVQIASH